MSEKIKVAVIGSCVTRDLFNSKFVSNYKDFYECVSTVWQTSMISFMSDRTEIMEEQKECKDEVSKLQRNTINRDIGKLYRNELIETQPDYIIFDLYTDIKYGLIKTNSGYLTNNPNGFRKTLYFKEGHYEQALNIFKDEQYLELFYDNFSKFEDWVNANIPNCKIIITKFSEAFSYMTKGNFAVNFNPKICGTVAKDNKMYNKIYDKLSSDHDVQLLDMQSRTYFGDYDHVYGNKPWHFTQQYYDDLYKGFNEIILKNQLLVNEHAKERPSNRVTQVMKKIMMNK